MNIQQLEYIIAVDNERHFVKASEKCFVTQATLSMMIHKLEDELNVKIFDRSKQPVVPTQIGEKIIAQARRIISETKAIKEIIKAEKKEISGELKLGIIPTIAPYLLPLFIKKFNQEFPLVKITINEFVTETLIKKLNQGELDAAILATPLADKNLFEQVLFYEKLMLYVSSREKKYNKAYVLPKDIELDKLLLLEEGHCLRSQILNLCELKKENNKESRFQYEAGSIETLKNLVEANNGVTIIPELATLYFSAAEKKNIRYFKQPFPVREISLVTHRQYAKSALIEALQKTIKTTLPKEFKNDFKKNVLEID
jgi:LysR family hydrogen peroxide-inducible transcriptional activator